MAGILTSFARLWDRVEMFIGGLFLTASVVIISAEIVCRTFLATSITGADEIAAFAVIWSVFFTASLAVKKNAHIRVDILLNVVPRQAARAIDAIGTLLAAVFAAYLTYSGVVLVGESYMLGEVTMTVLRMKLWIPQLIMPVGGFLLTVRLVQRFFAICFLPAKAEESGTMGFA